MAELAVKPGLLIPDSELAESFSRSGGPGGQHVNKTSSRVELTWSIADSKVLSEADRQWLLGRLESRLDSLGVLRIIADSERSQRRNRDLARRRLASVVREALRRPKRRRRTRPTASSIERRLTDKRRAKERKTRRERVRGDDQE